MNALAKHTLGPWRIGDAGKTVFGPFTASPCPVRVATMPEASPRCGVEERKANTLLIAAAPEMAEAMLSILALYKEDPDDLETMDKGIKLMEPVLRKAGLLS